jgi:glycine/D-amino acid oxidase-like deaminating enzyme
VLVEAKDRVGLEENVKMQQGLGVNTRVVTPDELRAIDPFLAVAETFAASYEPEGGYADPAATVMSFGEAAKRRGAQIWQDTRVTKVLRENGRVVGVESTRGEISAPAVVNCANAWAP